MWLREPSDPAVVALKVVSGVLSPQLTSTAQGLSAPGSVKEPRSKLGSELPSSLFWSAGAVTDGGMFVTLTVLVYSVLPPSLSRILAPTSRVPLSDVGQVAGRRREGAVAGPSPQSKA